MPTARRRWVLVIFGALVLAMGAQSYTGFSELTRQTEVDGSRVTQSPDRAAEMRAPKLTGQSRQMIERSRGFRGVFKPDVWPPGYPLLLRVARELRLPLEFVNFGLLLVALVLMVALVVRAGGAGGLALGVVAVYLSLAATYYNLAQFTAENLVVPLSLGAVLALHAYLRTRSASSLFALTALCAVAFASRWHAIAWLFPVFAAHLVRADHDRPARKWAHCGTWAIVSLAPAVAAMLSNYASTGFLTGMARDDYSVRVAGIDSWQDKATDFGGNAALTGETLFVDFLSPTRLATHMMSRVPREFAGVEWVLLVALILVVVLCVKWKRASSATLRGLLDRHREPSIRFLVAELAASYLAVTIVLWSVGNNDPIYSRFLYPAYVFLVLLWFFQYESCEHHAARRGLWLATCLGIVGVNLWKISHVLGGPPWW